ncbi:MAG: hypothetical protein M1536_02820 [Firmicutes bacterium]|nr:hypothetical protein [Bacillota bacterium]
MIKMKQLNIRISHQEYDTLAQLALESKKTISQIMRELIEKEEQELKKKRLKEVYAFGKKFAKERGLEEEQIIEAVMESRYGKNWKEKLS